MKCDSCEEEAMWWLYAAYDLDNNEPHPVFARYPGAMFIACNIHLPELMLSDLFKPNSTKKWLITVGGQ